MRKTPTLLPQELQLVSDLSSRVAGLRTLWAVCQSGFHPRPSPKRQIGAFGINSCILALGHRGHVFAVCIPTCSPREAVVSESGVDTPQGGQARPQVCCSRAGPATLLACRGAGKGGPAFSARVLLPWRACLLVRVSDSFPESARSPGGDADIPTRKQALSPACLRLCHSRRCHPRSARPVRPLTSPPTRRKQQFTHYYVNNTFPSP